jgi:hypothetical protein
MSDIFENIIICKNCDTKMQRVQFLKNGFTFRAVQCLKCGERIIHPQDEVEYQHYLSLRNKTYNVKLRMVGNSYTVSIPREIVNFINEQNKIMNELVCLSFERMGKLSLIFDQVHDQNEHFINKKSYPNNEKKEFQNGK